MFVHMSVTVRCLFGHQKCRNVGRSVYYTCGVAIASQVFNHNCARYTAMGTSRDTRAKRNAHNLALLCSFLV